MNIYVQLIKIYILSLLICQPAMAAVNNNQWQFELAPLVIWGVNLNGTTETGPITAPLDLSFDNDMLENLETVFAIHFEAQKNNFVLFSEYQYVDLTPSMDRDNGSSVDINFENSFFELGSAYIISRTENTDWALLAGIRYTDHEITVDDLSSNETASISCDDQWFDVFAGAKVTYRLSHNWQVLTRADIGGGGSDFVWNISAMAEYHFDKWGAVFAGYKVIDYDYDNDKSDDARYAVDLRMAGPMLGINLFW